MERNLAKTYSPKEFEDRIYKNWETKGAFKAKVDPNKKPFTIVMPPPNITGQLHMGHALDQTLQDVLTRWKRMEGYSALWLPGSDHASIATEVKVVENIRAEEGLEKEDLGRDEFLKRAWAWKEEYGGRITNQCRKLGDSCDWERERFTMDQGCNVAVNEFFVHLYEQGLIYRGNRLINWCPTCGTTLSDAEVEHEDKAGKYWYFRYDSKDGKRSIVVATSRPETMFGDVAIAVHPDDERYKDIIGTTVVLPLVGREIPIVADLYPDPEKGTGAVKITPAHDPNDFEVGERHDLEQISCLNFDATMNELAGKYQGMDRFECRKAWVKDLEEAGHLVKIEEKEIPAGECYRCNTTIEFMLSDQWFVSMETLAKPALEAAKNGSLVHVPERFEKTYLHWLETIRDWCISRQLWWGHRIPAYYCQDCGEITVSATEPSGCKKCGGAVRQDEDVLDTWFSSALWPFSTLGWPEETEDFKYFYPTDVLVTGYDIIFFWVVRMVFSAISMTGELPFHHVYVHGLVRDSQGRKMSKSLGNGIDPLEVIEAYGADALRFMLTTGITAGSDMRFQTERLEASRNFANKLWNASRFVIMNLPEEDSSSQSQSSWDQSSLPSVEEFLDSLAQAVATGKDPLGYYDKLKDEDKWILSRVNQGAREVTSYLEKYELAMAGQKVYDTIWNEFCDWYIELVKERLYGDDQEEKQVARLVLVAALTQLIKLLHPFMPFITEEIYSFLPGNHKSEDNPEGFLMKAAWPVYREELTFEIQCQKLNAAMEAIRSIRNLRAEAGALPSRKLRAIILATGQVKDFLEGGQNYIRNMANITEIQFVETREDLPADVMSAVMPGAQIFVPTGDLIDFEAERERLTKEQERLKGEVARVKGMLANESFVSKAPKEKVDAEKEKQAKYEEMLAQVTERLNSM